MAQFQKLSLLCFFFTFAYINDISLSSPTHLAHGVQYNYPNRWYSALELERAKIFSKVTLKIIVS